MFCFNCGSKLEKDSKYCSSCGIEQSYASQGINTSVARHKNDINTKIIEFLKEYIIGPISLFILAGAAWLVIRAFIYPHTYIDDETISIPKEKVYVSCVTPNAAKRKMIVEIESLTELPVHVAVVNKKHLDSMKNYDPRLLQSHATGDSYSPNIISGVVDAYITSEGGTWCAVVGNIMNNKDAGIKITIKTFFRLFKL